MQYKQIPGLQKPLSTLVFGTNHKLSGDDPGLAIEVLDMAYEAGFRTIDTANSYGNSEANIGKWLVQRGHREDMVILDKGCNPCQTYNNNPDVFSADTIREQIKLSQERLQTEYLDLYILHRDDISKPVDEIVEVLNEFQAKGIIGQFGGSNWRLDRILAANAYAAAHGLNGFTVTNPNYCLAEFTRDPWGASITLSGDASADYRQWLTDNQMPTFAYSSLGRGYLSGKFRTDGNKPIEECLPWAPIQEYHCDKNLARLHRAEIMADQKQTSVATICLAWLLAQPQNIFPLVNASSERSIFSCAQALDLHLTQEEANWLLNG